MTKKILLRPNDKPVFVVLCLTENKKRNYRISSPGFRKVHLSEPFTPLRRAEMRWSLALAQWRHPQKVRTVPQGPKLDREKLSKAAVGSGEGKSLHGFRRKIILVEIKEYLITEPEILADPIQPDSSASDEEFS